MNKHIEDKIHSLGGLVPIGDEFVPVEEDELAALESTLGATFPQDYREFLKNFGAAMFAECVEFLLMDPRPIHPVEGNPMPITYYERGPFSVFCGAKNDPFRPLVKAIQVYNGRMPDTMIPIADDGGGHQICLGIKGEERGKVYYWDHHNEWDEEDYLEDYGEPMPPEVKFQNVYLVAESFEDFILRLEKSEKA